MTWRVVLIGSGVSSLTALYALVRGEPQALEACSGDGGAPTHTVDALSARWVESTAWTVTVRGWTDESLRHALAVLGSRWEVAEIVRDEGAGLDDRAPLTGEARARLEALRVWRRLLLGDDTEALSLALERLQVPPGVVRVHALGDGVHYSRIAVPRRVACWTMAPTVIDRIAQRWTREEVIREELLVVDRTGVVRSLSDREVRAVDEGLRAGIMRASEILRLEGVW